MSFKLLIGVFAGLGLCYQLDYLPPSGVPPSIRSDCQMNYIASTGSLFVFGGGSEESFKEIWEYKTSLGRWDHIHPHTSLSPEPRLNSGSFVINDNLCVFGGLGSMGDLQDIWCFSIEGRRVNYT